jgi:hypothetical protein
MIFSNLQTFNFTLTLMPIVFNKNLLAGYDLDLLISGKSKGYSEFSSGDNNPNFAEPEKDGIFVRNFERGVGEVTRIRNTIVTASAIATTLSGQLVSNPVNVSTVRNT